MPRCFVSTCGNYYSRPNQKPVRYHTFPISKKLSTRWVFACKGHLGPPAPKYARVCSEHFSPNCYKRDLQHELLGLPVRHRLKPDAVPDTNLPGNDILNILDEELAKITEQDNKTDLTTINNAVITKKRNLRLRDESVVYKLTKKRKNSPTVVSNQKTDKPTIIIDLINNQEDEQRNRKTPEIDILSITIENLIKNTTDIKTETVKETDTSLDSTTIESTQNKNVENYQKRSETVIKVNENVCKPHKRGRHPQIQNQQENTDLVQRNIIEKEEIVVKRKRNTLKGEYLPKANEQKNIQQTQSRRKNTRGKNVQCKKFDKSKMNGTSRRGRKPQKLLNNKPRKLLNQGCETTPKRIKKIKVEDNGRINTEQQVEKEIIKILEENVGEKIKSTVKNKQMPGLKQISTIKQMKLQQKNLDEPNTENVDVKNQGIVEKCESKVKKIGAIKRNIGNVIIDPFYDYRLPVRSSIRIAKKKSIEHTSGPGPQPKSPKSREIYEKIKFMARFNLRYGYNPAKESVNDNEPEKKDKTNHDKMYVFETQTVMKVDNVNNVSDCVKTTNEENKPTSKTNKFVKNQNFSTSGIIVPKNNKSLNRMHVMEDVEEGCNVSGALPSSPGHAEQRPDPSKETKPTPAETSPSPPPTITNGIINTEYQIKDSPPSSPIPHNESESVQASENNQQKPNKVNESDSPEEETKSVKETTPEVTQIDNDDSNSNDSNDNNNRNKRKCDDEESPSKRLRQQQILHEKVMADYIENAGCNTPEDIQIHSEQLLAEIRTLNELAKEKEREWNNILHLKKIKEELLLRMQRKRQVLLINSGKIDSSPSEWDLSIDSQITEMVEKTKDGLKANNSGLMMVPIVSSSPATTKNNISSKNQTKLRSILPKPGFNIQDYNNSNQQEFKTGRQGPIIDVKSLIADYRQKHPETVPRRGRRLKSVLNNSNQGESGVCTTTGKTGGTVLNMTSLGLGTGAQVRQGDVSRELGILLSSMDTSKQDGSRPSSADSSSAATILSGDPNSVSFKDMFAQFAKMSQAEKQELQATMAANLAAQSKPYPEVTLHPVPTAATATISQPATASLLHGILTKSQNKTESNKPTTFSPTLARLLTAPERVSSNNAQAMYNAATVAALNSGMSLSDILTTNTKSRNEITITPIGQFGPNSKHKDGENLGDEDEAEDSADRLVIDEDGQGDGRLRNNDNGSEMGDEVPQCQGCHQKSAQFVCAGCGNQWYCSRDCQVAAWDEHSEVCSG